MTTLQYGARALARSLAVTVALGWATLTPGADNAALHEAMSHDGLQKIELEGVGLAYALPGASLSGYTKVRLDPVVVAFHKDWKPTRPGSSIKLSAADRERIRALVAGIVAEEFTAALRKGDAYQVVDGSGADVLGVTVNIVNLIVTAPDTLSNFGRSTTYVTSAGEMTLVAELRDSESGQVIARVVDRSESRAAFRGMVADQFNNANEARNIAAAWARILRNGLDKARSIGSKQREVRP